MYLSLHPDVTKVLPTLVTKSFVWFHAASQLGTLLPEGFILTKMILFLQPEKVTDEAL